MDKNIVVKPFGGPAYKKEDLMKMEPTLRRALLRVKENTTRRYDAAKKGLIFSWVGGTRTKTRVRGILLQLKEVS